MDAFEIAIVGAGRMGATHIRALRSSDAVRVVAVAEPDRTVRDRVGGEGLRTYETLAALIEAGGFDAALVASPTRTHLSTVLALAAARIPILCEKPCGLTADEARQAGLATAEARVPLQVGYWRRFVPSLRALREEIRGGRFGAVQWVHAFQWDEHPPPATFFAGSGGIVIDMGVHELDLARWLTGEEVADAVGLSGKVGVDGVGDELESASFLARLSGGGLLSVTLGRRFPPGDGCRVQVIGVHRTADLRFLWPPDGDAVFEAALRTQTERFAAWVGGGEPEGATAEDAIAALAGAALVNASMSVAAR